METKTTTEANKAIVRGLFEEVLNKRRLEESENIIGQGYVGIRGQKGPAGFTSAVAPIIDAFPDVIWTVEDLLAADDKVVVRWTWKGTSKKPFNGFPVTGAEMTNGAIAIYRIADGKIEEAWMETDRLGFFLQLGVVPAEQVAPRVG
jgi:steroid delta-isomerase-like uncharacterized protein